MTPSLARGVIDTPILVLYREGDPDAAQFIQALRAVVLPDISQWSMLCLYNWAQSPSDRNAVHSTRALSNVVAVSASISRRAAAIMDAISPPIPFTAGDALVAATAIERKLPLYTLDSARFAAIPLLTTIQPY